MCFCLCGYVHVWVCSYMCRCLWRSQVLHAAPRELELKVVLSHPTWALETLHGPGCPGTLCVDQGGLSWVFVPFHLACFRNWVKNLEICCQIIYKFQMWFKGFTSPLSNFSVLHGLEHLIYATLSWPGAVQITTVLHAACVLRGLSVMSVTCLLASCVSDTGRTLITKSLVRRVQGCRRSSRQWMTPSRTEERAAEGGSGDASAVCEDEWVGSRFLVPLSRRVEARGRWRLYFPSSKLSCGPTACHCLG